MLQDDLRARAAEFSRLHATTELLVLPNPWDVGTARLFAHVGFKALATTSAGLAFSMGRRDGDFAISREETFSHVAEIVAATSLPVTADLENGFGISPETVEKTVRMAGEVGLCGCSIEDATYQGDRPIIERTMAVERIQAAVEAATRIPHPFVLTARAENFIRNRPDLDDTLWRLRAYDAAGADVLYAPGLPSEDALREACRVSAKPFNYVAGVGPTRFTLAQLKDIGVRRVTTGSSMARVAYAAALRAAQELHDHGTLTFLEGLPTVSDFNAVIDSN